MEAACKLSLYMKNAREFLKDDLKLKSCTYIEHGEHFRNDHNQYDFKIKKVSWY